MSATRAVWRSVPLQAELFATGLRARAVGFVYPWSRLSAIFSGFVIAVGLCAASAPGIVLFITGAMLGRV